MRWAALGLCACLAFAETAGAESSTSPAKSVAFASTGLVNIGATVPVPAILAVTLAKGKKKHLLHVSAFGQSLSIGASLVPRVNGLRIMEPLHNDSTLDASIPGFGSGAGEWWLDLDAAETAHPGEFIGVPLVVELLASEVDSSNVIASLRAQLVKRK